MHRKALQLVRAASITLGLAAGTALNPVLAATPIVAGTITNSPPLIAYADNGQTLQGVIVDIAAAMDKHLPGPITFKPVAFPALFPAMESKQIDIAFTLMNDTPEREKLVDFVDFFNLGTKLLVQYGNPQHVTGLSSLCGKSVATVRGSTQIALVAHASAECVAAGKSPIKNMEYAQPADARMQAQTGRVAAFLGQSPVLSYIAEHAGGGHVFEVAKSREYQPVPLGIAVPKSDTQLRDALQTALNAIIADGTYQKILARYGVESGAVKTATINGGSKLEH